jgi:hypothetical protein
MSTLIRVWSDGRCAIQHTAGALDIEGANSTGGYLSKRCTSNETYYNSLRDGSLKKMIPYRSPTYWVRCRT